MLPLKKCKWSKHANKSEVEEIKKQETNTWLSGVDSLPSNLGWNYFNCVLKSGKTLNGSVEGAFSEQVDYLYKGRKSSSTKARQVGTSENSPVGLMRGKKRGWRWGSHTLIDTWCLTQYQGQF